MVPIRATIIPSTSPMGTLIKLAPFIPDSLSGFYVIRGSSPSVEGGAFRYPKKQGRLVRAGENLRDLAKASVHQPSTIFTTDSLYSIVTDISPKSNRFLLGRAFFARPKNFPCNLASNVLQ